MRPLIFALTMLATPVLADVDPRIDDILDGHILPRMQELAEATAALDAAAQADCAAHDPLKAAYHNAMDAWMGVSHLRFGPAETDARAFALAFWPDTKGFTPKALGGLISKEDPVVSDPSEFATVSVAGRGLYAMEFLLFDDRISAMGSDAYRCLLIQSVAADSARTAAEMNKDWATSYAALMRNPGDVYQSETEVLQELYKALLTGIEINANMRLGRPMGSFTKPRPKRAENWRSGRSLHNVTVSLTALQDLGARLADGQDVAAPLAKAFGAAITRANKLDDPVFASVATPAGRFQVEVLQQNVLEVKTVAEQDLGPALGVSAGFNSLDGD